MIDINPTRIPGRWRDGYALDQHTVSSTYLGEDEFGHARFETQRSAAGELLYRLKYKADQDAVGPLVEAAAEFIHSWRPGTDLLVPVPPSKHRQLQPVLVVAEAIAARVSIEYDAACVRRVRDVPQLKDVF